MIERQESKQNKNQNKGMLRRNVMEKTAFILILAIVIILCSCTKTQSGYEKREDGTYEYRANCSNDCFIKFSKGNVEEGIAQVAIRVTIIELDLDAGKTYEAKKLRSEYVEWLGYEVYHYTVFSEEVIAIVGIGKDEENNIVSYDVETSEVIR